LRHLRAVQDPDRAAAAPVGAAGREHRDDERGPVVASGTAMSAQFARAAARKPAAPDALLTPLLPGEKSQSLRSRQGAEPDDVAGPRPNPIFDKSEMLL